MQADWDPSSQTPYSIAVRSSPSSDFVPHPPSNQIYSDGVRRQGETKKGLIDQLEQIHNLVPSVLNEGLSAGIVELNWLILTVGDKQQYHYQAYHLFSRKCFHPVSESYSISVAQVPDSAGCEAGYLIQYAG